MPPVLPLFESALYIQEGNSLINQYITQISISQVTDAGLLYEHATELLYEQKGNENSYKAYRSELTTFFHWCFDITKKSAAGLSRREIARYLDYCQHPPVELIGFFNVAQFKLNKELGLRVPNDAWRPFVGKKLLGEKQTYTLSENALKTKVAILSSFYSYLMSEDFCERNPAQAWMNHSRFSSKKKYRIKAEEGSILSFNELQWSYVISAVEKLARDTPELHQRSLFLIKLVYFCYLRISEVSARAGYTPVMDQFRKDRQTGIWSFYIPHSKGGKPRSVAISKALLTGLVAYRRFLKLSDYPIEGEHHPLFIRHRAAGRGREMGNLNANLGIRQVREEIDKIIEYAASKIESDGLIEDAHQMRKLTAHNIRHTGITHDININGRSLSHVQADAGHESIDTTSQYLHTSQIERHESAQNKPLDHLEGIE